MLHILTIWISLYHSAINEGTLILIIYSVIMPIAKGTKQNKGNELYILLADCSGKMPRVDLKTSISSPDSRYLQFYDIKRTMDLSQASRHFLRLLDVVVMARSALELCIFKAEAATFSGKSRAKAI